MMLVFKSNTSQYSNIRNKGFKAIVRAVPLGNSQSSSSSTTTSSTTASTTTTTTAATTTVPSPRQFNCETLDITFALAHSGAISRAGWDKILLFVAEFVSKARIGPNYVRVAAVSFGSDAILHFNLNDYNNYIDLRSTISNMFNLINIRSESINTAAGLRLARTEIYEAAGNRRDEARKFVVLITDGELSAFPDMISEAAYIRQRNIEIVSVGIGDRVRKEELVQVSGQDANVLLVKEVNDLNDCHSNCIQELWSDLCEIKLVEPLEPSGKTFSWECSFDRTDRMCGMSQDPNDQFDWTLNSGPTPSDQTGPDRAFDGNYYIYIEASNPRKKNDIARIYFPQFYYTGEICIRFAYNMYGFHINTLQLEQYSSNSVSVVWSRSGQQGHNWFEAAVAVRLRDSSRMAFAGTRGGEFSGDISLDKISVKSGSC